MVGLLAQVIMKGILQGLGKGKVVLRVWSREPYSAEFTSEQLRTLALVSGEYGSRVVRTTPRQAVEIPDIEERFVEEAAKKLKDVGFETGASGEFTRHAFACSRWCLYNSTPVVDMAKEINDKYGNVKMPAKLTISFSACSFSCARSKTSDIGLIGKTKIKIDVGKCIMCGLCIKEPLGCQVDALRVSKLKPVEWDSKKCVSCGFCSNVCPVQSITVGEKGFDIYLGGGCGMFPKEAKLFKEFIGVDDVLMEVEKIVEKYMASAGKGERLFSVIERLKLKEFD